MQFLTRVFLAGLMVSGFLAGTGRTQQPPTLEPLTPDDLYFKYQVSFHHEGESALIDRASYTQSPVKLNLHEGIHLDVARAWHITTGSSQTIVALLDDGFYYDHEDIRENVWRNSGESGVDSNGYPKETNGIDDDNNGYVDDLIGWDFVFEDPDPDCYIFDGKDMTRVQPYWHSIDAMGIIGARGNNGVGVAGINWKVSMMLLKIAAQGDTGNERIQRAAKAIRYAVDNGARVINWSGFVAETESEKLSPLVQAIEYAESRGVLLVCAAGNSFKNLDLKENCFYPACAPNGNVITVAEVDFNGELYRAPEESRFIGGSNYGSKTVDIAAIAQNYTTHVRHARPVYMLSGGTSNAAPVVTGVVALMLSIQPDLDGIEIKRILLESARKLPGLEGKVVSGGMVNAMNAVMAVRDLGGSKSP